MRGPPDAANSSATIIGHTARMPDEHSLALRQADQLRTDIANVESDLAIGVLESRMTVNAQTACDLTAFLCRMCVISQTPQ